MADTIVPLNQIMRTPLRELLNTGCVDLSRLSSFCRILLTTDGTLTETLEAYFLERIQLVKVSEGLLQAVAAHPLLSYQCGEDVIERAILLQGATSGTNYVYAESTIMVNELPEEMRVGLLHSKTPIGRLWLEHKLETFKEMIEIVRQPAGELGHFFELPIDAPVLSRTYRVYSGRRPVILITEKFPEQIAMLEERRGA